jgi:hypothetical protein
LFCLLIASAAVFTGSGCRLCCDSEDAAYPAYGGVWERTDRDSGRVGSLFDPGGARQSSLSTKESADQYQDALRRMGPMNGEESEDDQGEDDPSRDAPEQKKFDSESEEEFQQRRKKIERMLNTSVIPGEPLPPSLR